VQLGESGNQGLGILDELDGSQVALVLVRLVSTRGQEER
jgi:hypothetical protein